MATKETKKLAPVVATINMKGGVGKTTITAHVLRLLYFRLQKRVLLIDLDPQFNLTQTIVSEAYYERLKSQKKTVLSIMEPKADPSLFTIASTPAPAPSVGEVALTMRFIKDTTIRLDLVPGDFGLVKYTLMNDEKSLLPIRQRFLGFIDECRKEYDLVCIDCNPSSSFLTQCGISSSSHLLVPVRPDRYSILGLELLDQFVNSMASLPKKPEQIIILNGIPTKNYDPSIENTLRSSPKFGTRTLSNFLTITKLLEANPTYTGFATDRRVAHRAKLTKRIEAVVDELGQVLGLL
jgi:chromosome partitioning protein